MWGRIMECDRCGRETQKNKWVLTKDGFFIVTPFYRCDVCEEEWYDLEELERRKGET